MSPNLDNLSIPLSLESIQEFAWGLSLFFSSNEQERKFGEDAKNKWDKLVERYKDDERATKFFDNVNALMLGTSNDLALLRKQANDHFTFLDSLKNEQIKNLNDLANLSKDAESIAARIAAVSIGGGISFIGLATDVLGTKGIFAFLIGAGVSYFIIELLLRAYCSREGPQVMKDIQEKKKDFMEKEFQPKSQQVLQRLLEKVDKIAGNLYKKQYARLTPKIITDLSSRSATTTSGVYITTGSFLSPNLSEWMSSA